MEEHIAVKNPATGELVEKIAVNTEEEIKLAFKKGHHSFKEWAAVHAHERSRLLQKWSDLIQENEKRNRQSHDIRKRKTN